MKQETGLAREFWRYDDWQLWAAELQPWLDERFHARVQEHFTADVKDDWLTWLDSEQSAFTGVASSVEQFRKVLVGRYEGIRLYHATRIAEPAVLCEHGLRAWSPDELRERARREFSGEVQDDNQLERAIALAQPEHRGGLVYTFRMLRDAMPSGGVCFARNGSEWLETVARMLKIPDYLERMRGETRGYLIACDVPWGLLESDTVNWLAKDALLTVIARRFYGGEDYSMPSCGGECVPVSRTIPVENIKEFADLEPLMDSDDVTADQIKWQLLLCADVTE